MMICMFAIGLLLETHKVEQMWNSSVPFSRFQKL